MDEEMRLNPPIPPEPEIPPAPINTEDIPLPDPLPEAPKVLMKIKTKKKVNKLKKKESKLPAAYQSKPERKNDSDSDGGGNENKVKDEGKISIDNAFESVDDNIKDSALTKLDAKDEIGHIDIKLEEDKNQTMDSVDIKKESKTGSCDVKKEQEAEDSKVKEEKLDDIDLRVNRNQPGMDRLRKGSAALLAYQNLSKLPQSTIMYGEDVSAETTKTTGNTTFFTEYNIPCCLRRCKFPKEQVCWFMYINFSPKNYAKYLDFQIFTSGRENISSYLCES